MSDSDSDSDSELLARFAAERCEDSFAELVRRHLGLVHAAALRRVGSPQMAEDIAQSVFLDLARHAGRLAPDTVLASWLYEVTRRTAVDAIRRETRRQQREQTASEMNLLHSTSADWLQLAPVLDDAMQALDGPDRDAVLLRFFENQSLRDVGAVLGVSEDAAQKRVRRALEQLRDLLARRGISVASGGLAGLLSSQAAPPVSEALAAAITGAALRTVPRAALRTAPVAALLSGLRGVVATGGWPKLALGTLAIAAGGVIVWWAAGRTPPSESAESSSPPQMAALAAAAAVPASVGAGSPASVESLPDPRELLRGVARARQQIVSGTAEFSISRSITGQKSARDETNEVQTKILFDGSKLRSEETGQEYSYTYAENEAEQEEIRKRADAMDRESAVREGLLKPFSSRHVLVTDGHILMDLWDTGDGHPGVTLNDPGKGSSSFLFDPRCLGLGTYIGPNTTVESCLGYAKAKSVELMGQEIMDGVPAWHVRVELPQQSFPVRLDFWMDAARPERVIRHSFNGEVVVSRYDESDPGDPIPSEVQALEDRPGGPRIAKRFVRTLSDWDTPVESRQFTLAGLGMAVGTPVTDVRKSRRMGYWTGSALSGDLPTKEDLETPESPDLAELLALLDFAPASEEAREAAIWIVLNNPDGPEVDRALEVLRAHHTRAPGLLTLCREQARVRHRGSKALLEALLRDQPDAEVRGTACFILAMLLKEEAKFGQNAAATAAAVQHLERAITEFAAVRLMGNPIGELAAPELDELRRLCIGRPAPETAGQDLDGQAMRLSDYRGRVVVLVFWSEEFSRANELLNLAKHFAGEPFSIVGVFVWNDLEAGRAEAERRGMSWRSFWDRRDGPIAKEWNVRGWPDVWVLDRQGIIRHRELRGPDLRKAVEQLLKE